MHAHKFLARQYSFILAADTGGAGGGGSYKEKYEAEVAKSGGLETQLSEANKATDLVKKDRDAIALQRDELKGQLEEAQKAIKALQGDKTQLTTDLNAAKLETKELKDGAKTSDQKARETAAAHGILAPGTDAKASGAAGSDDAVYEEYAAMKPGREKSQFFRKNAEALNRYQKRLEREGEQAA